MLDRRVRPGLATLLLIAAAWLAGCSTVHYPINPPLARIDLDRG